MLKLTTYPQNDVDKFVIIFHQGIGLYNRVRFFYHFHSLYYPYFND